MLKASLWFIIAAIIAFVFADCEISTLDPLPELQKMAKGALFPSFTRVIEVWPALVTTVTIALAGTTLGVLFGSLLSVFYTTLPIRLFCTALRSVHELFWAILLIPLFGLSPICGTIALAIPFTGTFAKVFSEINAESDKAARNGVPKGTSRASRFIYSIFPVIYPSIKNYTSYRFECALRSSAVLGFLGIPTIGFYLETMFKEGFYAKAAGFLIAFYILIFSLRYLLKTLIIVPGIIYSYFAVTNDFDFQLDLHRYFTELTPWPLRGSQTFSDWFGELYTLGGEGLFNTVVLTQISLVTTAVLTLALFPFASKYFAGRITRTITKTFLIIMRTTPEFFIAYAALVLFGPSMIPAIIALSLHNAAIMAHLTSGHCDKMSLPQDINTSKVDTYFFWFLPQLYGQFLAFLFLRWEIMIRESALLGLIGIYTIGFYIDSAIDDDHMDVAIAFIAISGLLTLIIDLTSHTIRKRMQLSGATSCGHSWG